MLQRLTLDLVSMPMATVKFVTATAESPFRTQTATVFVMATKSLAARTRQLVTTTPQRLTLAHVSTPMATVKFATATAEPW
jgi:hypothetical protein